jgi:hypothetical protein
MSKSLSLSTILTYSTPGTWLVAGTSMLLLVGALYITLLAENCRIPFDDPNTHLELTMIHEVMVLDHSGPAFGLILYAAAETVCSEQSSSCRPAYCHGKRSGRLGNLSCRRLSWRFQSALSSRSWPD